MAMSVMPNTNLRPAGAGSVPGPAAGGGRAVTGSSGSKDLSGRQRDLKMQRLLRQFVGMSFYQTLLRQARNSSLKSARFHGGRSEEIFGSRLDGVLAERMAQADQSGIAEAIYRAMTSGNSKRSGA